MVKVPRPPQLCILPFIMFPTVLSSFVLYLPHLSFSPSKEAEKFQFGRWQYLTLSVWSPSCFSIAVWRIRLKGKSSLTFSLWCLAEVATRNEEEQAVLTQSEPNLQEIVTKEYLYVKKFVSASSWSTPFIKYLSGR